MSRYYGEYRDCYEQGRKDEHYYHTDYDHDRYSDRECDIAYFQGRREEERERERQEAERREEEHQEHLRQECIAMERAMEEQQYWEEVEREHDREMERQYYESLEEQP